jgi:HlyD family secretion protein
MTQQLPAWHAALDAEYPEPSLHRIVLAAALTIAIGFGGFATWAVLAPLDSGIPAMGQIVVASKRKTVSLLDPGILGELLVQEGDRVEAGQPLLRLDDTQARAALAQALAQRSAAQSKLARLSAEQQGNDTITFPPELTAAAAQDATLAELLKNEQRLFDSRRQSLKGALAVQQKKIAQLKEQIAAFDAQSAAAQTQLRLLEEHLGGMRELLAQGYAPKSQVLGLEGQQAGLKGSLGESAAHKAEAQQNIAQTELELIRTRDDWQADVGRDMQDTQAALSDVAERIRAADDILKHKLVTAPDAGTVTDIKFFTVGSSIGAGQPILDIVPRDDRLLVEANVPPNDIEHVHLGQQVNVRLVSYKQHKVPVLTGHLTYVSADRQIDQRGDPFFLARAELDPGALAGLKSVQLYPGMPAEVLIIGGERAAIDYFLSPITDSVHRALHEE